MESTIFPMNSDVKSNAQFLQQLIVGYGFRPTEEELINYLKSEEPGLRESFCIIPMLQDICKINPWDLPDEFNEKSIIPSNDQECWFICPKTQSKRNSRKAPCGSSWKITGQSKVVKAGNDGETIGSMRVLVFPSGGPTTWVIHEYHLLDSDLNRNCVLCHVMRRQDEETDNSSVESEHGANYAADVLWYLRQPDPVESFDELLQPARRSQISLPSNINQFMNAESPSFMDYLLENRLQPENQVSSDMQQLFQPARRSRNSFPTNINQFMNAESPSFVDYSLENRLQPENRVSSDMWQLFQPARQSRNSLPSNIHQCMITESPSFMDPSLENGINNESIQWESLFGTSEEDEDFGKMLNKDLFEEVEDVEVPSGDLFYDDFFDGDQMQSGHYGQTSHSHDERPALMENRRSQTISVHGVFPVDKKKGTVENKFNGSLVTPEKSTAPLVRAGSVESCSKDEEPRSEKVRQETATKIIKQESISLDEAAATAKVLTYKEHGSAGNSPKKTNSKEIEHAREKSNSVTALTGPTTVSTECSTSPPLLNLMNMVVGIVLLNTIAKYLISDFHCRFAP